jgi:hypothetical protein
MDKSTIDVAAAIAIDAYRQHRMQRCAIRLSRTAHPAIR